MSFLIKLIDRESCLLTAEDDFFGHHAVNIIFNYEWGSGVPHGLQNRPRPACQVCWVRFPGGPAKFLIVKGL